MAIEPIRPEDIEQTQAEAIPDKVIEVFNSLIVKHFRSGVSVIRQGEIIDKLNDVGFGRREIFDNHWLDVEALYRKSGWSVTYDGPGFNETYEPTFTFRMKKAETE